MITTTAADQHRDEQVQKRLGPQHASVLLQEERRQSPGDLRNALSYRDGFAEPWYGTMQHTFVERVNKRFGASMPDTLSLAA